MGVGFLQAQICVKLGGILIDATAGCELTHRYQLQPLLPHLMSLQNLFLMFEGPQLFLYSKFSITVLFPHLLWERRREEKHNPLKHWPGKLKCFSQALLISDPQPNP